MIMFTRCPECGNDDTHMITAEWFDEEGYLNGYTLHCAKCENVWKEMLR